MLFQMLKESFIWIVVTFTYKLDNLLTITYLV